jgi:hypothetical protein
LALLPAAGFFAVDFFAEVVFFVVDFFRVLRLSSMIPTALPTDVAAPFTAAAAFPIVLCFFAIRIAPPGIGDGTGE